ncbi:uncharacterized protein LAESUDRAFT_670156 [Laetiporus sulphureus 93-53]|uniref:GST N-terminal domain-containing protein n=1 Tax=Laetiporus sulphureus 93-53 TaxID=1314785 RepID=A0A165HNE7_9APHY|nr:uncharacterized protein LAESUDRAFT_670156 [Laetiporus sulphureus 93-53]KZT11967.1 hypothetical protein LAESUDRAFT_670156 [Laetiporus sulphureus 93-53]
MAAPAVSSSEAIIFYDLLSTAPGKAWSPNTWKTRFALNYKGLPYKTVWVEYPDVAGVCNEIGASPTDTWPDGSPWYTLPAIYDPNTKTTVSDSAMIARYLDKTYPDTPVLIPPETDAFHAAFQEVFLLTIQKSILPLLLPPSVTVLNPPSAAYFRRTREMLYSKPLEEFSPDGPVREGYWQELQAGFAKLAQWMSANGQDKPFFMDEKICHADLLIAGWLKWAKTVWGPDSTEWATIMQWDSGKWARFMASFEPYEVVDA